MKKVRFRRLASIFLCLTMLFNFMPVISFADASTVLTSTTTNTNKDSGISLTKTATYDPATGKVTTEIEAYTTGTVTQTSVAVPTDILLVLDVSYSMMYDFDSNSGRSNERMEAMQNAVKTFITHTAEQNESIANDADKHSISLISFASENTPLPNSTTKIVSEFLVVNETNAATLRNLVDGLEPEAMSTAVDKGLELALGELQDRKATAGYEERNTVVIVFTDGDPGHSSGRYDADVAMMAVNNALAIKETGATIYTIGIFNGADPNGTSNSNIFMNYMSSNYPSAYGTTSGSGWNTQYNIYPGTAESTTGYYMAANDAESLNNVFESISQNIGTPSISLGEEAKLVDIISDYFKLEGVGSADCITVKTADYLGSNTWAAAVAATGVTALVDDDTDTVTVSGFDFDENYISETARGTSFYGKKLIISFVTTPNYDAIDAAAAGGAFADGSINTNEHPGSAAILDSNNTDVAHAASPVLPTNTVTYFVDGVQKAKYLRFPGADVTLLAKPADTATHTYSAWATADVTLSGSSFTMPAQNVTLTSVSTPKQFKITYEYVGNVPDGTTPATAPAEETRTYGESVTLPTVTVPAGYEFNGWVEDGGDVTTTTFTMPAEDLHFTATFTAKANSYTVEHYLMNEDGTYPETADHSYVSNHDEKTNAPVVTGMEVTTNTSVHAHVGYTFDADNTDNVLTGIVLADGELKLKVYYERLKYNVTYVYDNIPEDTVVTPADPSTLNETGVLYGASVSVAPPATAVGYEFIGWTADGGELGIVDGEFTMPARDVTLHGIFIASDDTKYTVEHYKENANDDGYTLADIEDELYGKTGDTARAAAKSSDEYIGFTYNAGISTAEGVIKADGTLVLKLYYDRTEHTVTYSYTNTDVPDNADPENPSIYNATFKYGATVTIAEKASALGYTFNGWNIVGTDITVTDGKFTMPARNVQINGHFDPQPNKYTVEHYLMGLDGKYPTTPSHSFEVKDSTVLTGMTVYAEKVEHVGFTYDTTALNIESGEVAPDGSLVLKLHYARNKVQISYEYKAPVPAGATPADLSIYTETLYYEQEVDVRPDSTAVGYLFSGWSILVGETSIIGGKIKMPNHNVKVGGSFTASEDTRYIVEHYLENADDDNYTKVLEEKLAGTTGTEVTGAPKSTADFYGFTYNETKSAPTAKGVIKPDGSLVLKLYYDRTEHTVEYAYTGTVPSGANPTDPSIYNATYKYGATVTIADVASALGYSFNGWNIVGTDITVTDGKFSMPARDVKINGHFDAQPNKYTVEHYLMGLDGNYPSTASHSFEVNEAHILTGTTVHAEKVTHVGFTYDESAPNVESGVVAPDGSLVLKLYYARNKVQISYKYDGTVPADAAPADLSGYTETVYFEQEVTVRPNASADGYTFSGWSIHTGDTVIVGGKIKMPNQDVVLYGSFTADGDTPYTVEHWFENLNDNGYTKDDYRTQHLTGKTDTTATASPLSDVVGFTYDPSISEVSGVITGDGELVLKLYYNRTRHSVSYEYIGLIPSDANPAKADLGTLKKTEVKYGTIVDVAAAATASGYTFGGWDATGQGIIVSGGSFTMPAKDIVFYGQFNADLSSYTVQHYLMAADGTYSDTADHENPYTGVKTGDIITVTPAPHVGYTYDETKTLSVNALKDVTVLPDGKLVIKVYYARNVHNVTYKYENVPAGVTPTEAEIAGYAHTARYGESVAIKPGATAPGYVFSGWYIHTGDTAIEAGSMVMPDHDVVLHGSFTATGDTLYTVEHYFENLEDSGYTKDESKTQYLYSKADTEVTAVPLSGADVVGFTYNPTKSEASGKIAGDGSLVLRLYYNRTMHSVSYQYIGLIPSDANPAKADLGTLTKTNIKYGTTVDVAAAASASGYTFSGWDATEQGVTVSGGTFTMPAADIIFYGQFHADLTSYTVEHYLMTADGNYLDTADHVNPYTGVKTGDVITVTPAPHVGYTYDETKTLSVNALKDVTVLPDGKLVIKVYYARNVYNVTYHYENVPAGVTPTESEIAGYAHTALYGESVAIKPGASAPGYVFSGWYIHTGDTAIEAGSMVMPDHDVVLHGSFTATGNTPYTIEHYFENLEDGNYTLDPNRTQHLTGKTGATATAVPLPDIIGCSYDPAVTAAHGLVSGEIKGDGSLVLKLYYTRTRYNVSYQYVGSVPTNANPADPASLNQSSVKYGETVVIAAPATAAGYTFDGWKLTGEGVVVDAGTFKMPARDVILTGYFNHVTSAYTVEHWLEDVNGSYSYLESKDSFSVGVNVHDVVKGTPKTYNTYTYNAEVTKANNTQMTADPVSVPMGTVNEEGTLVLKLYYTRNAYNLTYRFEGNVPAGMTAPAGQTGIKHGHPVDLAEITAPAGYGFDGWYYGTDKAADPFTMPRENVELVGYFTYADGVKYQVKYYLQNLYDDGYTEDVSASYVGYGKTGDYVYAATKTFSGFSYVDGMGVWNGHIKADGSLVLELYYNRNTYTVSYYYFGTPPADATVSIDGTPLTLTAPEYLVHRETVRHGMPMTVKSALTADNANYEFRGWYTSNLSGYAASTEIAPGTAYTMPTHNVDFYGSMYDYIVYYDLDGGTLGGSTTADPKHVNWNDADLLPAGEPEKTGMIFSGWTYEADPAFITSTDKYSELAVHTYVTSITLKANYANNYVVSYEWGHHHVPADVVLPTDNGEYVTGDTYTVDTVYYPGYSVDAYDIYGNIVGIYTFSGWTDPFGGVIADSNVVIHGKWDYTPVTVTNWTVTYSWTGEPDGDYTQTLPASAVVTNGADYTVDTVYTAGMTINNLNEFGGILGTWTFSGWDRTGTITITEDILISGVWTYEPAAAPEPPPYIPPVIITDGDVILTKVDGADHETVLANAVFELYEDLSGTSDILIGTYTTDAKGQIRVNDLEGGRYYFVEIRSPEGYLINNEPLEFVIGAGMVTRLTWENIKSNIPDVFSDDHYAYIIGRDDGLAHPEAEITRAEVATIFFRLLSDETRSQYMTKENPFTDVTEDMWCNTAISTMYAMGIIFGRGDGTFDPTGSITRAEFAAIAARFEVNGNTADASFTDIYEHWAQKEINIAANNGWALGYEDGTFRPDEKITRAEAMAMVNRVLQRIPEHVDDLLDDMVTWPDNMDTTTWYYLTVQEATNSHYYGRRENGYEYWTELRPVRDWAALEME